MMLRLLALCVLAYPTLARAQQPIDNVAAFARLYGVARWFYPSDAAATLDWNRFAVHGVSRVREARTPGELESTLKQLFAPLGPGIQIGASLPSRGPTGSRDPSLVAWHYRGPGITENVPGPYSAKRMNRVTAPRSQQAAAFGTVVQVIPADTLRGKTIRMKGQVRAPDPNSPGWAGLWLRVDRTGGAPGGFFDNMQDRPVRDTSWREYVIEGPVASDASQIVFGVISVGPMTVEVDAIEIEIRGAGGNWTRFAIPDGSFESAANSGGRGWAQNGSYAFTRPTSGAAQGTQFIRVAPLAPGQVSAALPADSLEIPVGGATIDIDLALGLKARVPMSLTDGEARTESPALASLRVALANFGSPSRRDDVDVRLADAIVAWGVFRHFYPYWSDLDLNWDGRLKPHLQNAFDAAATREAHLDAVRALVADVRDGHGGVRDLAGGPQSLLPVQYRILGGRLVVTASRDSAVPVGSVVTVIDGAPASTRLQKETELASGTLQWRQSRAAMALQTCRVDSLVTLTIEPPSGRARDARLSCIRAGPRAVETRPDSISELQPGVWYVDLTRVRAAQLRPMLWDPLESTCRHASLSIL